MLPDRLPPVLPAALSLTRGTLSSRSLLTLVAVVLTLGPLPACKKTPPTAPPAATQALDAVKVQVAELRKKADELRARASALPEGLPGADDVRAKLLAVEEVMGTEVARVEWLSGELAGAVASRSKAQLEKITETIRGSVEGSKRLAQPVLDLGREVLSLEKASARRDGGAARD